MSDDERPQGYRKDGKVYKEGNTREDGSYEVGRGRTPPHTRFATGDGRKRGRRTKGTKNLATDWAEELAMRITITEGGKRRRVTKQRGLVIATADRGMKTSDRAAETAFRHAAAERGPGTALALSDQEIIEAWLPQRLAGSSEDQVPGNATEASEPESRDGDQ